MFIVEDKRGNKAVRLSRYEQGLLAFANIKSIEVQKMREQHLPTAEIVKADIELAAAEKAFDDLINRES